MNECVWLRAEKHVIALRLLSWTHFNGWPPLIQLNQVEKRSFDWF